MTGGGEQDRLTGRLILVVEDDPLIAIDMQDMLTDRGAEVLGPAPSVGAALKALSGRRPDAAVLDVNLRGVMSTPVAEALRREGVPFVVATGYSRGQLDGAALREAPLLAKPVDRTELLRVLGRLLADQTA